MYTSHHLPYGPVRHALIRTVESNAEPIQPNLHLNQDNSWAQINYCVRNVKEDARAFVTYKRI